ncbi:MAG: RidA family protein [Rhodobacteraceae bacterium]|nr:RidA family protein [Paracoccaceae bacterium]
MTEPAEKRLRELGLELPDDWAPRGRFLPFRKDGPLVWLSGQINEWNGAVTLTGPVPDTADGIAAARSAARICALNLLYRLRTACDGDLDRVDAVVRLGGFVSCLPGFSNSPKVIDGATDVFVELYGDRGWHARTAVGVAGLPGNAAVEVDAVIRLRD